MKTAHREQRRCALTTVVNQHRISGKRLERLSDDLGKVVTVTEDWQSCLEGADIMVEASRLETPEPLFRTEWAGCDRGEYGFFPPRVAGRRARTF